MFVLILQPASQYVCVCVCMCVCLCVELAIAVSPAERRYVGPWRYSGITAVSQWCYGDVTVVLQWCHSGGNKSCSRPVSPAERRRVGPWPYTIPHILTPIHLHTT
jgi:hypothetical protein